MNGREIREHIIYHKYLFYTDFYRYSGREFRFKDWLKIVLNYEMPQIRVLYFLRKAQKYCNLSLMGGGGSCSFPSEGFIED